MTAVLDAPVEALPDALPLQTITTSRVARFTVERYHQLIGSGYFTEADRFELLEGYLVTKMSKNAPHTSSMRKLIELLAAMLPPEWQYLSQDPITLASSEPEPDIAVMRRAANAYADRHPGPADIGLVIEVSDSSLDTDQIDKLRIYARNAITVYWIVNLIDRQIEVYERPAGTDYLSRQSFRADESVSVVLDGQTIGQISVNAVLPGA